jgi:signal recognition particle subunit SRP19
MSRHARIEEVSDSESDPSDMDPEDFDPAQIMAPVASSTASSSLTKSSDIPAAAPSSSQFQTTRDPSTYKHFQCLYPIYFDSNRSRAGGRRVGKELAVENPLALELVNAVKILGLNCVFEPGKCHPKDWANPGRVKVHVKEKGRPLNSRVKNSMYMHHTPILQS